LENTSNVRKQEYLCISCGNILIPKLGEIRQKHFAHKHFHDCSRETYLHVLAKEIFFKEYSYCLTNQIPFNIELEIQKYCNKFEGKFGSSCNLGSTRKVFDLTRRYNKIYLETRENIFIPDILLLNDDETKKLYIEIAVTHKISKEKQDFNANIIEIQVEDEEDILFLKDHLIGEGDKVKFYNFTIKPVKVEYKGKLDCPNRIGVFRVFNTGKSLYFPESYPRAYELTKLGKDQLLYCELIETSSWSSYKDYVNKLIEVYAKGVKVKNCYLCKYYGDNRYRNREDYPIFCKFLKICCCSNQAAECEYFRV
jgi:hypothetical protein